MLETEKETLESAAKLLTVIEVMQDYIIDLSGENRRLRATLAEIAAERVLQPGTYEELTKGLGTPVPTKAAMIAEKALMVIQ